MRPLESDHTRRAPWSLVGGSMTAAARRVPDLHGAALRIEPAVDAVLPGEPDAPALVEGQGVEVHVAARFGQRPALYFAGPRIDAHDGVRPAFRDPRRAVGPDCDVVRAATGGQGVGLDGDLPPRGGR